MNTDIDADAFMRPDPAGGAQAWGNPGKRPLDKAEPKPAGDLYAAPEWMSDSQREGWAYAITHAPYGLLKQLDRSMLAIWVVAEDLHRQAAEKIVQYGLLTKSPNAGLPLQSPYLAILNKQAQIMLKAGAELGFSPASRTRVQVLPERNGSNPFARNGVRPFPAGLRPWDLPLDPGGLLPTPWDNLREEEPDAKDAMTSESQGC